MSGNRLAAARRLDLALALLQQNDAAAAHSAASAAVEADGAWVEAWWVVAQAAERAGLAEAAESALRRCLALDPEDRVGAIGGLVRLGAEPAPPALPPAYVSALFDDYAPRFDRALLERLDYQGPAQVAAALERWPGPYARALDLGCGTGLIGAELRPSALHLEGWDLSAGMLARAAARGCYDALEQVELQEGLVRAAAGGRRFDLVAAADVFTYLGDLSSAFAAIAGILEPTALFVATGERAAAAGWHLQPTQRYAQHPGYLAEATVAAGLRVLTLDAILLRREAGRAIEGWVLVARRG